MFRQYFLAPGLVKIALCSGLINDGTRIIGAKINVQFLQSLEQQAPPSALVVDDLAHELGSGEAADG